MRAIYSVTVILVSLVALAPAGCLEPKGDHYVSSQALSLDGRSEQAATLWEAVKDTLRRHHYRLDRVDRRAGVITTLPVASQHFFEFWRHDVDTQTDFWEATLNPTRRWVEVHVGQAEDGTWSELAVVVHKERLSSPDRQFNSTGAAYQYFGNSLPSTTGAIRVTTEDDVWLDAGRDPAMESYLLERFLERAGLKSEVASRNEG